VSFMHNHCSNDSGRHHFSRRARLSGDQVQSFATAASRAANIANEINEE